MTAQLYLSCAIIAAFSLSSKDSVVARQKCSVQISVLSQPEKRPFEASSKRYAEAVVTAYCSCEKCCGSWSKHKLTSKGRDSKTTRGVAVDPKMIKYGSIVTIPGFGDFLADDTGGAMRKSGEKGIVHIDLRFFSHKEALQFGRKKMTVTIKDP